MTLSWVVSDVVKCLSNALEYRCKEHTFGSLSVKGGERVFMDIACTNLSVSRAELLHHVRCSTIRQDSRGLQSWHHSQAHRPSPLSDPIIWQYPSGTKPIGQTRSRIPALPSTAMCIWTKSSSAARGRRHRWCCMMSLHKARDSWKPGWGC